MNPEILIFDHKSMNEERIKEFNNFFYKWDLTALFTNEHKATSISVSDNDLRAITNVEGKYREDLIKFHDYLQMGKDNKRYEEGVFKLIDRPRTFLAFMQGIRKVNNKVKEIMVEDADNLWNIVYYDRAMNL